MMEMAAVRTAAMTPMTIMLMMIENKLTPPLLGVVVFTSAGALVREVGVSSVFVVEGVAVFLLLTFRRR
jgi:hypothetical protein